MTAQERDESIIDLPGGLPGFPSEEERERLEQETPEESLERSSRVSAEERESKPEGPPEAHRWPYHGRHVLRGLAATGTSLLAIIGGLAIATGKGWKPYREKTIREKAFQTGWGSLLGRPEDFERQIEILFRKHLIKEIDPDNGKTWTFSFREGAVSLIRMTDDLLDSKGRAELLSGVKNEEARTVIQGIDSLEQGLKKEGKKLEWSHLSDYLKEKGFSDPYLSLIGELWKEAKTGKGKVREKWEQIKKLGLLTPKSTFVALYAADVTKVWKEAIDKGEGNLSRREFLRAFTAPHLRKPVEKAIREIAKE